MTFLVYFFFTFNTFYRCTLFTKLNTNYEKHTVRTITSIPQTFLWLWQYLSAEISCENKWSKNSHICVSTTACSETFYDTKFHANPSSRSSIFFHCGGTDTTKLRVSFRNSFRNSAKNEHPKIKFNLTQKKSNENKWIWKCTSCIVVLTPSGVFAGLSHPACLDRQKAGSLDGHPHHPWAFFP